VATVLVTVVLPTNRRVQMDLITAYTKDQQRRGLSAATTDKRSRYLRLFEHEVGLEGTRDEIETWLDRYPSAKTKATILSHLGCFYTWATEEGHLTLDPTAKIRAPRVPRKLPRPIPDEALEKALANATPLVRVWLLLGSLAGLRCKEIAGLCREDVMATEGRLRVVETKGGDERMVPLNPELLEALELWGMPASGWLFRQRSGGRMTAGDISHHIGDYLRGLGITSTPHALRHWFGTHLLAEIHDLRTVGETMGHKDIRSTAIYADWDRELAKAGVTRLGVRHG